MKQENLDRAIAYLETWLELNFSYSRLPGMTVAIQHKDAILLGKAYGFADLENKVRMTTKHRFRIASHSKMFTSLALARLVDAGKLRLDTPIVEYLPWLAKASDKRYREITSGNLLEHTAGVIRDGEDSDYWQILKPFPDTALLKKDILKTKLIFDTNETFKYSNYGFSLLGLVIEAVSGQSYAEYVKENLLDPLGMKDSGSDTAADKHLATGYSRENTDQKRSALAHTATNAMAAATGFYGTVADLCKFSRFLYDKKSPVVNPAYRREMIRMKWNTEEESTDNQYGMGLVRYKVGDRYYLGHSGGFPGFITVTITDPKENIAIVVLTNAIDGGAVEIAKKIAQILQAFSPYKYSAGSKQLDEYQGRYENIWSLDDIISAGDKLVSFNPRNWGLPIKGDELLMTKKDTFKVTKSNGYESRGESVKFLRNTSQKIFRVIYSGSTMLRR